MGEHMKVRFCWNPIQWRLWFYVGGGCMEDDEWLLCLGPLTIRDGRYG